MTTSAPAAVFLTQSHPKQTQGSDLFVGTSLDQIHARALRAGHAALPSMQFTIPNIDQAGGCTYNYSCAYTDSTELGVSPTEPLPDHPRSAGCLRACCSVPAVNAYGTCGPRAGRPIGRAFSIVITGRVAAAMQTRARLLRIGSRMDQYFVQRP